MCVCGVCVVGGEGGSEEVQLISIDKVYEGVKGGFIEG